MTRTLTIFHSEPATLSKLSQKLMLTGGQAGTMASRACSPRITLSVYRPIPRSLRKQRLIILPRLHLTYYTSLLWDRRRDTVPPPSQYNSSYPAYQPPPPQPAPTQVTTQVTVEEPKKSKFGGGGLKNTVSHLYLPIDLVTLNACLVGPLCCRRSWIWSRSVVILRPFLSILIPFRVRCRKWDHQLYLLNAIYLSHLWYGLSRKSSNPREFVVSSFSITTFISQSLINCNVWV